MTTALLSVVCALAPTASARVTVVPGSVQGGGTETLAVRLSNEQPDLATTRLELTFPTDLVIPSVEVAPMGTWVATVAMRPVDPPVTIDGEEVDEAVASILWTGGEVAPTQFEQFLVTVGPLPADGGRLVLAAAQTRAIGFRQEGQRMRAARRRRAVRVALRTWPLEKVRAETRSEKSPTGAGRR